VLDVAVVGVLGISGEVVGDLVIPSASRGSLKRSTELGEEKGLKNHCPV